MGQRDTGGSDAAFSVERMESHADMLFVRKEKYRIDLRYLIADDKFQLEVDIFTSLHEEKE